MQNSTLKWDDALPLAIYCFNVALLVNGLDSPFYLVHGRDPVEGRFKPSPELLQICRRTARQISSTRTQKHVEDTCQIASRDETVRT